MKTLFINLPNKEQVIRRYMCSYNASNMLYPPLELMYLSSLIKKHHPEDSTLIVDAIAENLTINKIQTIIQSYNPDLLVFMPGFEIFSEDINCINQLKTNAKIVCFGHLPTVYPKETLEKSKMDFIIFNEPELIFLELYNSIKNNKSCSKIKGIAYKKNKKIIINKGTRRISNLDELPFPDYSALRNKQAYTEPLLKKPFTVVQTTRGCPFNCSYCVHTFGRQTYFRSAKNVVAELIYLVKKHKIKSIKLIDDTFNVNQERTREICRGIINNKLKLTWTCLSRADTLDLQTLKLMKKAGCKRLFIGIESGSQRILNLYNKGYKVEDIKHKLKLISKAGIESLGFFIVGAFNETKEELNQSINLAKESNLDYVIVSKLCVYPGTELFEKFKSFIDFNLFPYKCEIKNINKNYIEYEQFFYKKFYFRPKYMLKKSKTLLFHPTDVLKSVLDLVKYTFSSSKKSREDLF